MRPVSAAAVKPKSSKRQKSEEVILDAFERTLIRDGLHKIGVNAVMREAGLAKPLLYDYFDDLNGLAKAWVARRGIWPGQHEGSFMSDEDRKRNRDPYDQLKSLLVGFANGLRGNPVALELLAADLTGSRLLGDALSDLRQKWRDNLEMQISQDSLPEEIDIEKFITIFYPAIVYLCLRSRRGEPLGTMDLSQDEGWQKATGIIARAIDDLAAFEKMKTMLSVDE